MKAWMHLKNYEKNYLWLFSLLDIFSCWKVYWDAFDGSWRHKPPEDVVLIERCTSVNITHFIISAMVFESNDVLLLLKRTLWYYHRPFNLDIFELITGVVPSTFRLYRLNKKIDISAIPNIRPTFIIQNTAGLLPPRPLSMFMPKTFVM